MTRVFENDNCFTKSPTRSPALASAQHKYLRKQSLCMQAFMVTMNMLQIYRIHPNLAAFSDARRIQASNPRPAEHGVLHFVFRTSRRPTSHPKHAMRETFVIILTPSCLKTRCRVTQSSQSVFLFVQALCKRRRTWSKGNGSSNCRRLRKQGSRNHIYNRDGQPRSVGSSKLH